MTVPARMALHTAHRIMRNLFFGRVVDKMSRTGPIDDLDLLVKLATRGYWHAIAPIQNPREALALLRILKQARPRGILEIGTAGGGTLFAFTRIAAADAQLVSIDLPGGPGGGGYPPSRTRLYQEFPLSGQRLELIREDSHDPAVRACAAELFGERGLDFLFIDGDHSYDGVKARFRDVRSAGQAPGTNRLSRHRLFKRCRAILARGPARATFPGDS